MLSRLGKKLLDRFDEGQIIAAVLLTNSFLGAVVGAIVGTLVGVPGSIIAGPAGFGLGALAGVVVTAALIKLINKLTKNEQKRPDTTDYTSLLEEPTDSTQTITNTLSKQNTLANTQVAKAEVPVVNLAEKKPSCFSSISKRLGALFAPKQPEANRVAGFNDFPPRSRSNSL